MPRRLFGRRMAPPPSPPPQQPQAAAQVAPAPVPPPGLEAAALAAAADGVVATDPAGQIALVNRAALSQTGFAERELIGNTLHGLLHPACEDPHCPVIATERDGNPRTFLTETMRRRDGSQIAAVVALSAMREGGLVASLHDLADRRREEDALRATAAGSATSSRASGTGSGPSTAQASSRSPTAPGKRSSATARRV
jgi:PAS domain S-box-containing protein